MGPVAGGHLHRLRVAPVRGVVTPAVAQVDPAGEGDVAFRRPRVPQHHQLLVVRAAPADPLVEQHLAAGGGDRLTQVAVLRLAVGQQVEVGAPDQALDHHAPLRGPREELRHGRPVRAQPLVRVAPPVGEEEVVAGLQGLHLVDQPVEVHDTVN